MTLQPGDRVRQRTIDDAGLPSVRYGFVEDLGGPTSPVRVLFDGEISCQAVDGGALETVEVSTVELTLRGEDLFQDAALRPGLLAMWQAEAAEAAIVIDAVHPFGDPPGTGLRDAGDSWALAEVMAGGTSYMVRAVVSPLEPGLVRVRADRPNRWDL